MKIENDILKINDPLLRSLICELTDFERNCLRRFLKGVGDSQGRLVFFKIKSSLKKAARAGKARR